MLASDGNGPGVAIHPSIPLVIPNLSIPLVVPNLSIPLAVPNPCIPLVVPDPSIPLVLQMANLTTKGKTMLNSLPVRYPIYFGRLLSTEPYVTEIEQQDAGLVLGLPQPSSVVVDNDLSSESDVVETRPPKRTHINLQAPENSHGRPLVRRHSPTENWRSTGSRQDCRTQNDLHKRLRTKVAWQQPPLSKIHPQHLKRRLYRISQVPDRRARYRASSGNGSISPLRTVLFTMLQNFIYKQKSVQASLGLPPL